MQLIKDWLKKMTIKGRRATNLRGICSHCFVRATEQCIQIKQGQWTGQFSDKHIIIYRESLWQQVSRGIRDAKPTI